MTRKWGKVVAIQIAACCFPLPVLAGTPIYKCVANGQTTLTDRPCPGDKVTPESNQPPTVVPSSKDPSPVGKWSGQLQFQETANGQVVQAAHSVALTNAEFTSDGKVTGSSHENGCRLLGVWSQSLQVLISLDLTLSDCAVPTLNRRYRGMLTLARPDSSGRIDLQSIPGMFSDEVGKYFDIKGTLHR
jgi:hypothetical protein